jgi:hypothetical protein
MLNDYQGIKHFWKSSIEVFLVLIFQNCVCVCVCEYNVQILFQEISERSNVWIVFW